MTSAAQKNTDTLSLDRLHPDNTALFFDFDGVIAGIVDDPSDVTVPSDVLRNLTDLRRLAGKATAIVSGREIDRLDQFLAPLRLPAAGVHGAERRTEQGEMLTTGYDETAFAALKDRVERFASEHEGLVTEAKAGSVALHYRGRPDLEEACMTLADALQEEMDDVHAVPGKMVVEIKLADRTKADAIRDFMDEPPFFGRTPVFFGDDVTDEDGFRAVNDLGGLSVKVGDGETAAQERLKDTAAFQAWLGEIVRRWSEEIDRMAGRKA